jgi:hypothetical protein
MSSAMLAFEGYGAIIRHAIPAPLPAAMVDRGTFGDAVGFDHHLSQVWASGYRNDADGRLPVFL